MPLIVGLTGGIGSGKTTATRFFAALGAEVVDTDDLARELTQPQGAAMAAIRKDFPRHVVREDGALDRSEMRSLVFSDSGFRGKLEAILHPLIREEVVRRVKQFTAPCGMIVVPLLFEKGGYQKLINRVLVVDCEEIIQIERAVDRTGLDPRAVRAIVATQVARATRLQKADDIIDNNGDVGQQQHQVNELHRKYLAGAKTGGFRAN